MLKHESKLIDPTAEEIVATLTAATADANKRCRARLLKDDPAKWRKFARTVAAKREGWDMFRGGRGGVPATQVLGAWWTDAIGRKHVVVRGRRIEHDEAQRLLYREVLQPRPPLWHAYPEYVCQRQVGKQVQIVCACGCGAVGTPESLGWMGETCGPCFDRKEELGSAGLRGNLPGVLYSDREPLGAVACSPDGNRVAAEEGVNSVTYWDLPARTRTMIKFNGTSVLGVAITPDGRHLLVSGLGSVDYRLSLFASFDLTADPPRRVDPEGNAPAAVGRVAALPDPELALLDGSYGADIPDDLLPPPSVEILRVPSGERVNRASLPPGALGPLAVSPDGKLVAAVGASVTLFDLEAMQPRCQWSESCQAAAFSHDGKHLICHSRVSFRLRDVDTGKAVAEWRGHQMQGHCTAIAVDPAGSSIYLGTYDGKLFVLTADALELRAVLEWHLGAIQGLAVSADGSRLFSSGGDGCVKVWPIQNLLRGL